MQRLKFMLEYNCSPVWVYEGNELLQNGLPHRLSHRAELEGLLRRISEEYDDCFINTPVEFSYNGFASEHEETAFDDMLRRAVELLREAAGNEYEIELDPGLEKELY